MIFKITLNVIVWANEENTAQQQVLSGVGCVHSNIVFDQYVA